MIDVYEAIKSTVLVFIIAVCAGMLWDVTQDYRNGQKVKDIAQGYIEASEQVQTKDVQQIVDVPQGGLMYGAEGLYEPLRDCSFFNLLPIVNDFITDMQDEINPDIIGWLRIPGTQVDYPVLKADDNATYLYRDIFGNDSRPGSLFVDYRCAPDFNGFHSIIYGHNMKNGSMFGALRNYADPDFFDENRYGFLWSVYGTYRLEFFAYMVITSDDTEIYANPLSAEAFYEYVKDNARIYREPCRNDFPQDSKVLTLSTCGYEFDGARIVLIAAVSDI